MRKVDIISSSILGLLIGALVPFVLWRIEKSVPLENYLFIMFAVCAPLGLWVASLFARKRLVLFQIGKFGIVGTANFIVDVASFHAIILFSGGVKPRDLFVVLGLAVTTWTLFKVLSFVVATSHSFLWNKLWTFGERDMEKTEIEYAHFLMVSIAGLLINGAVFSVVFALRPDSSAEALWGTLGAAAGAMAGMAWNFVGYKFFVFKK
ncbi:GtrA family protein [Candidatus Azambacteria bacterium]|nr:GtrA family protein [Candidatus Azambacteria bacterium]MBI3684862.1 GtrA family protein [Candidatus Azambacteria bacterium]